MSHVLLGWLTFIVVGAGMGFLRYSDFLTPEYMGMLVTYGPYILLLIHIVIVLMAFGDTVFQGILCIIIPFYSFYYLFFISDVFYVRAVVAGLLIGIGEDSFNFYRA